MIDATLSPICRWGVVARQRQAVLTGCSWSPVLHRGWIAIQRQSIFARLLVHKHQISRVGGPMGPVVVPWVVRMISILINALPCFLTWDHRDHPKFGRRREISGERKATAPGEFVALRFSLRIFSRNCLYMSGPVVPSYLYPATTRLSGDHDGTTMGPPPRFGGPIAQYTQMILNSINTANCRGGGYLNAT